MELDVSVEHALSYLLLMLVLVLIIASVLMLKRRFSPGPTTPPLATNLSRARPSGSPLRTEWPPRMRSAMPITEMWTGGRVRRRPTVPQRERPEIAAHRRVAEGRARPNDVVPNVIFQRPEVDWRPRKGRPFELSFFHSQIDALEHCAQSTWRAVLFGKWRWWMWLAERARVDALVEGLAAQLETRRPSWKNCEGMRYSIYGSPGVSQTTSSACGGSFASIVVSPWLRSIGGRPTPPSTSSESSRYLPRYCARWSPLECAKACCAGSRPPSAVSCARRRTWRTTATKWHSLATSRAPTGWIASAGRRGEPHEAAKTTIVLTAATRMRERP
jgi:hypothetical protein